jgi:hypothetical protein
MSDTTRIQDWCGQHNKGRSMHVVYQLLSRPLLMPSRDHQDHESKLEPLFRLLFSFLFSFYIMMSKRLFSCRIQLLVESTEPHLLYNPSPNRLFSGRHIQVILLSTLFEKLPRPTVLSWGSLTLLLLRNTASSIS